MSGGLYGLGRLFNCFNDSTTIALISSLLYSVGGCVVVLSMKKISIFGISCGIIGLTVMAKVGQFGTTKIYIDVGDPQGTINNGILFNDHQYIPWDDNEVIKTLSLRPIEVIQRANVCVIDSTHRERASGAIDSSIKIKD